MLLKNLFFNAFFSKKKSSTYCYSHYAVPNPVAIFIQKHLSYILNPLWHYEEGIKGMAYVLPSVRLGEQEALAGFPNNL
jgi:hypothetical protein